MYFELAGKQIESEGAAESEGKEGKEWTVSMMILYATFCYKFKFKNNGSHY